MAEKFNTRIQHKHDTEANWNKALNFIPKIGELIIYDNDSVYSYSRMKIGDGITTVSKLPFIDVALDARLDILEDVSFVEISASEVDALFKVEEDKEA